MLVELSSTKLDIDMDERGSQAIIHLGDSLGNEKISLITPDSCFRDKTYSRIWRRSKQEYGVLAVFCSRKELSI